MRKPNFLIAAVVFAAALPVTTLQAAEDRKSVSPSDCTPYAPDTTAAEIQITPTGIYNPGTTIEKVICPLPRDAEFAYADGAVEVNVYYRTLGGANARVTCTLFVGSSSMQTEAVFTTTVNGPLVAGGTRTSLTLFGATQPNFNSVPSTLVCAISPKVSVGAIYQYETTATNVPDPPA